MYVTRRKLHFQKVNVQNFSVIFFFIIKEVLVVSYYTGLSKDFNLKMENVKCGYRDSIC